VKPIESAEEGVSRKQPISLFHVDRVKLYV
jgi:hypothetical protein